MNSERFTFKWADCEAEGRILCCDRKHQGQGGYNICYYCDLCTAADADEQTKQKHLDTCVITFL